MDEDRIEQTDVGIGGGEAPGRNAAPPTVVGAVAFRRRRATARFRRILFLAAAVLAGAVPSAAAATDGPGAIEGTRFSRLTSCGEHILFLARDPGEPRADTLLADPATAVLTWGGGPYRGLAAGRGDTVFAACRLGVDVFSGGERVAFHPWVLPLGGRLSENDVWPPVRGASPEVRRPARTAASVEWFPERYLPLKGGSLLFLIDAEHPPADGVLLQDVHARRTDGVEWTLARNLQVLRWVVSSDSTAWALAARLHLPDYGGTLRDVVLAGRGDTVHRFDVRTPASLLWEDSGALWILDGEGRLVRIVPQDGAWTWRPVERARRAVCCAPAAAESLWTWTLPAAYPDSLRALREARTRPRDDDGNPILTWAGRRGSAFVPCWGAYFSRAELHAGLPDPPREGARVERVPVSGGGYLGPVARIHLKSPAGEAVLRSVGRNGANASELWWRFTGGGGWVRLAGPWSPH